MAKKITMHRTRLCVISVFIAALHFPAAAGGSARQPCECSSSHFASNYAHADRIFEGRIRSGQLDEESGSVDFKVQITTTYRGQESGLIHLSTSPSEGCQIDVYAGSHSLFILGKGKKTVSICDVQFDGRNSNTQQLATAISFVENYTSDRQKSEQILSRNLKAGADVSPLRSLLNVVNELDSKVPVYDSGELIIYRDLEVRIKNNKVVSHVWR